MQWLMLSLTAGLITLYPVHGQYDSTLAMSSLYYIKTSYCDSSTIASWSCGDSCSYHADFEVANVYRNDTTGGQGFSGRSANGQIVVSWRGSSNIENWIHDLDFTLVAYPFCSGCYVHKGFWHVYRSMASRMLADVSNLLQTYPGSPILVTGHSLGAAVAVHTAIDLLRLVPGVGDIKLYTFGDPRVGDPTFAAWVPTILPQGKQFRITHAADPVPHLPPIWVSPRAA